MLSRLATSVRQQQRPGNTAAAAAAVAALQRVLSGASAPGTVRHPADAPGASPSSAAAVRCFTSSGGAAAGYGGRGYGGGAAPGAIAPMQAPRNVGITIVPERTAVVVERWAGGGMGGSGW
jgi:hypothetical protein